MVERCNYDYLLVYLFCKIELIPSSPMALITRTEEMLLLTVCKLRDDAAGMQVRKAIEAVTGRRYSVGGIYVPLDRLVRKGLLRANEQGPTPQRGGRRKRMYEITPAGLAALREVRQVEKALWSGLPEAISLKLGLT